MAEQEPKACKYFPGCIFHQTARYSTFTNAQKMADISYLFEKAVCTTAFAEGCPTRKYEEWMEQLHERAGQLGTLIGAASGLPDIELEKLLELLSREPSLGKKE